MIKSIVLAVVVSLVIWALTFDLWFEYNRVLPSLGIALAAGLIIVLIVRALANSGLALQLIIVGVAVGLVLFAASKLFPQRGCTLPANRPIIVTCGPVDATPDVCAKEGEDIEWVTSGVAPGITIEIHGFKKIRRFWPDKKESPLEADPTPGNNQNNIKGKIKITQENKGRKFKYSVTCTPGGTKDPMIEVPPRGR